MNQAELKELLGYLTPAERAEFDALIEQDMAENIWAPLPGPQTMAYESDADVIGFGGAAGGGKTDLALGKALMRHRTVFIVRKNGTEHTGMVDRLGELLQSRDGFSSKDNIWRGAGPREVQIEFGSLPNPKDEEKYRGRPHDLIVYDEVTSLQRFQVEFLMAWNRTTVPGQRCQTLLTFNPPTDAEGRWVVDYFAPWLDKKHPRPALPGELRWFASINGQDTEVGDNRPFVVAGEHRLYDFDPAAHKPDEIVTPKSRTFIPSRVTDNPYLVGTGYMSQLQALPEPLRSQMLMGDFNAGVQDDAYQVIPTEWVEAAMAAWTDLRPKPPMDSMGVDVARGGADNTVIARRHELWFDKPLVYPGASTPNGPSVAGLAVGAQRNQAVIHIDVIGVGSSPYDFLMEAKLDVLGVNVAEASAARDRSGKLGFANIRSQLAWQFREALDPGNNTGIKLPPDRQLLADLCAFTWKLRGSVIQVESRDEIVKRIGRSPDWASAYFLALMDTPKRVNSLTLMLGQATGYRKEYDPTDIQGMRGGYGRDYDPLA